MATVETRTTKGRRKADVELPIEPLVLTLQQAAGALSLSHRTLLRELARYEALGLEVLDLSPGRRGVATANLRAVVERLAQEPQP